jgi:hypothetical protein
MFTLRKKMALAVGSAFNGTLGMSIDNDLPTWHDDFSESSYWSILHNDVFLEGPGLIREMIKNELDETVYP